MHIKNKKPKEKNSDLSYLTEVNSHERREEKRREEKRREGNTTLLTNRLSFKLLIALLSFILLFSISCESNEESSKPPYKPPTPKHELEGTWVGYDKNHLNSKVELKIDGDGNITLSPTPYLNEYDLPVPYSYTGKLTVVDIFNYTFTAKVSNYDVYVIYDEEGELTFKNSSNCTANYYRIEGSKYDYDFQANPTTVEFTKQ